MSYTFIVADVSWKCTSCVTGRITTEDTDVWSASQVSRDGH